jgi:HK97 family phage major capsid protein
MSQSIQELRERRNALAKQMLHITEEHKADWNASHAKQFDGWNDEMEILDGQIDRTERAIKAAAEKELVIPRLDAPLNKLDPLSPKAITERWLRQGDQAFSAAEWTEIRNTMSTTTTTEGGFTVPTLVVSDLIDTMKAYAFMRGVAETMQTATGGPMGFPGSDGTAEVGEVLAENATAGSNVDPAFTSRSLNTFKYSSKPVAAPMELLQDATVDIEAFIRRRLAQRIGRIQNQHFTTGTGTGQPTGIVTAATTGVTAPTGNTLLVPYDSLVDLVDSVDVAYHTMAGSKFGWMFNQTTRRTVRKIKDTAGRPIWTPSYDAGIAGGFSDSLLGYPVFINNDMAVPAANAKSIAFGNLSLYMIRDAMQIQLYRFDDSAYIKLGQIGFLAFARAGGNLIDLGGVRLYVHSAT